jgi:hypothetical protein
VSVANIICTGASLKGFDLNSIEGYKIAVNYAYKYLDNYDMLVAWDKMAWPEERLHTLAEHNLGTGYKIGYHGQLDRRPMHVMDFASSLMMAINIAFANGFKHVKVYGADMCFTNGLVHFYDDKPPLPRVKLNYERRFGKDAEYLKKIIPSLMPYEILEFVTVHP